MAGGHLVSWFGGSWRTPRATADRGRAPTGVRQEPGFAPLPEGVRPRNPLVDKSPRRVKLNRVARPEVSHKARIWRGAATMLLSAAITYGLWAGGHIERAYAVLMERSHMLAAEGGFGFQRVILEGNENTDDADIVKALALSDRTAIIGYDTLAAQARIEQLPWIKHAEVMRLLPATMHVVIEERTPFAVWQVGGRTQLIDRDGRVIEPMSRDAFPSLPLIVGKGAETTAKELLGIVAELPFIRNQVVAAVRVGDRRWTLKLKSGIDVLLPDGDVAAALEIFSGPETQAALSTRPVIAVDLRLRDRVTFRVKPSAETVAAPATPHGANERQI